MIRSRLGMRLDPAGPIRDQIRDAARAGAKAVVFDATGDLAPGRLSETGRRELRHLLRTVEVGLTALHLPTRRPFDTLDQLDDRLRRAEGAFTLAYELGTTLVLASVGALPPESDAARREVWISALTELGRRADHRGVRLAIETGPESGEVLRPALDALNSVGLAASLDPAGLLQHGHDPIAAARSLGEWVAHAYANGPAGTKGAVRSTYSRLASSSPHAFEWEEYLGALEEILYRGDLTVWPDSQEAAAAQFRAIADRLLAL